MHALTPFLAAIPAPPGNGFELGPLTVRYYGLAIAIGALAGITILRRRYAAAGGDAELADRIALWGVGVGFVGARLGYALPRLGGPTFEGEPWWAVFAIWQGGLALYGGLIAGTLTVLVLLRRWRGDTPAFFDGLAPAVPVAQAFGRLGNYFNQELYGRPTDLPWALEVDPPFRGAFGDQATFHPTFAYEALWNLALAAVILALGRRGTLRQGSLAFVYAIGYGTIRFLLEFLRTDTTAFATGAADRAGLFGLSPNGWVSVGVIAVGLIGLVWAQRQGSGNPDIAEAPAPDAPAEPDEDPGPR